MQHVRVELAAAAAQTFKCALTDEAVADLAADEVLILFRDTTPYVVILSEAKDLLCVFSDGAEKAGPSLRSG